MQMQGKDIGRLTEEQRITVAYFHLVRGIYQHDLAAIMNVNPGRVAEAVSAVRLAVKDPVRMREIMEEHTKPPVVETVPLSGT